MIDQSKTQITEPLNMKEIILLCYKKEVLLKKFCQKSLREISFFQSLTCFTSLIIHHHNAIHRFHQMTSMILTKSNSHMG